LKLSFKASFVTLFATLMLASSLALAALVEVPAFTAHVVDLTQTLSAAQQAALEAKLSTFEETKGSHCRIDRANHTARSH
jgi:uncharacterized protein